MERQVTITATPSKVKTISVNKATVANEITATPDTSLYYSNLSKQWATKMDGLVVGEDYSSKYYAENARVHAETAKMEASTTTELKNLLKEDFDGYTESLNNTKNLAIEEINTTSTVAIGNLNTVVTSSTGQINTVAKEQTELVASTANKALEDIETLTTNSEQAIETLSEISKQEIEALSNTIKTDANDIINTTRLKMGMTIVVDKVLSYEESQGLALQGTYVYKTAVAGERYGYPDFYEQYVNYKNNATATQTTLGSSTITIYNNANGLKFYDIANKGVIDTFFNSTGVADFYGIDETNERIFLPRNKYFAVTGGVMGNGMTLGLTRDGTTTVSLCDYDTNPMNRFGAGVYVEKVGTVTTSAGSGVSYKTYGLTTDSTKSGIELEPNENKYLYYCVGNTVSDTSWIDVVTQVNGGIKDLEDKTQEGIERLKASSNALTTTQITNCITEIPQDIKLELKDGTLTLKTGSKVYVPNGFEADGTTPTFSEVIINSDRSIKQNYDTNGMFLIVYIKPNGTQFIGTGYKGSTLTSQPTPVGDYKVHYITSENKIYWDAPGEEDCLFSLPIAIVNRSAAVGYTSIEQTFNGFGYIGSTVFVLPNVKGLIPNGRNEDGSLNNIECSFSKVVTQTNTVQYSGNIALQTDNFDLAAGDYYDEETNYNRLSDGRIFSRCVAGKFVKGANGVITSFNTTQPFRAVDYSEFNSTPHITETYQNGTSGYIVYSNGYCEQWGIVSFAAGEFTENGGTVTYLKPFKDTNYNGLASINNRPGFTKTVGMFSGAKTATSFSWGVDNEGGASAAGTFTWKVWGYIR